MRELFFFYGTLWTRTASPRMNALVQRYCRPLGTGTIAAKLFDAGAYPVAIASADSGDRVCGVLCELRHPERWLAELDRYEGFDPNDIASSEYVRRLAQVTPSRGASPVEAWVYFFNRRTAHLPRIAHGDYSRVAPARGSAQP